MTEAEDRDTERKRGWRGPAIVLAIALILRVFHLYQIRINPFFYHPIVDAWDYHKDALEMLRTGDWVGSRAFFQAPLTTYFLAAIYKLTGIDLLVPRIVQVMVGSLTAAGMFVLARRLFSEKAAWIAGLVTACYPLLIFFEGELLAPAITIFLDVAIFLVLFRVARGKTLWYWILPGLLLGLRALATTNILATIPVFWIWLSIGSHAVHEKAPAVRPRAQGPRRRGGLAAAAVFTLGILTAIAPVAVRNTLLHKEFVLVSSNAGINFYLGNSGGYDAKIAMRPGADWDEFVSEHVRTGFKVGPEMSGYFFEEALDYMARNPGEYLRLLLYKAYLCVRGDEIMRNQEIYPFRNYSKALSLLMWKVNARAGPGLAFPFGLLLPLAWPGCLLAIRRRHSDGLLLLAYGAVYALSVIAFFVTARYRLPVVVPLILLLAYGWSEIRGWWRPVRIRVIAISGVILIGLISNWIVGPMPDEMNPDAYYSLAGTMAAQGDREGAERYYARTLEMNPRDAAAWLNLGLEVYQEAGLLDRAETCYRKALEVRPEYATAVFNLGYLAELRGRPALAESLYLEAVRLDPLLEVAYLNLAILELSRADYAQANEFYQKAYRVNPESGRALVGLGVTAFEIRGMAPALEYFDQAIRTDPSLPEIYFNLALVYARTGESGKAADNARRATELDPTDDTAYVVYANQMRAAGRASEARDFLRAAMQQYPDLEGPRRALRELGPRAE
jgi:tetratricopeptide (TPR) repeat protein